MGGSLSNMSFWAAARGAGLALSAGSPSRVSINPSSIQTNNKAMLANASVKRRRARLRRRASRDGPGGGAGAGCGG